MLTGKTVIILSNASAPDIRFLPDDFNSSDATLQQTYTRQSEYNIHEPHQLKKVMHSYL